MRIRPLAALSLAAIAALALAGCSSADPDPTASASATPDAAGDLCSVAAPTGPEVESVTVSGEFGEPATIELPDALEVAAPERIVAIDGDGDAIADGDLVTYGLTVFDAATGDEQGSEGYETETLPVQVSVGTGPDQFFGCAPIGSRIVMTVPATESAPAAIWVLDILDTGEAVASGEEQDPVDGFPTVVLDESGAPTVTLPDGDVPTDFEKSTLKMGDGRVVEAGDSVLVQYHGVSWDSGEVFDQSWGAQPFSFSTSGGVVQGFTDAVVGETVGSQVVAVLPPSAAYGEGEINDADLTGQTLVFVVDILAAVPTPEAPTGQ